MKSKLEQVLSVASTKLGDVKELGKMQLLSLLLETIEYCKFEDELGDAEVSVMYAALVEKYKDVPIVDLKAKLRQVADDLQTNLHAKFPNENLVVEVVNNEIINVRGRDENGANKVLSSEFTDSLREFFETVDVTNAKIVMRGTSVFERNGRAE